MHEQEALPGVRGVDPAGRGRQAGEDDVDGLLVQRGEEGGCAWLGVVGIWNSGQKRETRLSLFQFSADMDAPINVDTPQRTAMEPCATVACLVRFHRVLRW